MAAFLNNLLLGLQSALPTDDAITVNARPDARPTSTSDLLEALPLGNRSRLEDLREVEKAAPQRKGMFGVKGTLRDIIGTLGDAFLVQSGQKAVYAPAREQERISDALAGFTGTPQEAQAALERVGAVNAPLALELQKQLVARQQAGQTAGLAQQKEAIDRFTKGTEIFGRIAGASNPETFDRVRPILESVKRQYGLGEEFIVPTQYDENLLRGYQYGGMPAQQQIRDVRTVEAERGRQSRYTPPQPKTPPRVPTLERIRDKIASGAQLTAGEERLYRESIPASRAPKTRASRTASPAATTTGVKMIYRDGRLQPAR